MDKIEDKKIREGGYTIEQGVEVIEGTPPQNFQKIEPPLLTKSPKDDIIKKKRKYTPPEPINNPKSPIGKLVRAAKAEVAEKEKTRRAPQRAVILPQHRAVLNELQNNKGQITKAMIAMSYSKKFAQHKAMALKETKSWQALMDENLPNDIVALRHKELLDKRARRDIRGPDGKIIEYGVDDGPDTAAVTKALEMAYKLRGAYAKEDAVKEANVTYNLFYKPGVQKSVQAFEKQLIRQIYEDIDEDKTKTIEVIPNDLDQSTEGSIDDQGDQTGADEGGR